ncbi:MAG: type III PLP-dependent enzyme [Sphaerobacter sp.]|nr:type III PLP-dependent enzyme [Sphaerobacter sp.]
MPTQAERARAAAERLGGWTGGEFCPDGVPLSELVARYGTPCYLYHGGVALAQLARVRAAVGPDVEIAYSIKANPSLGLCQLLTRAGAGAEVASAGELHLALAAGVDPARIVFAGPGKTDDELRRAVRAGIFAVNVESLGELERLGEIAEQEGRDVGVGLRINPAKPLLGSHMRMGGRPTQFGMDEDDLEKAVAAVQSRPHLILRGVHVYTATQVFDADPLVEHCDYVFDLACRAADVAGRPLEMVDLGGGFGVPYFEHLADFDLERFGHGLRSLLAQRRADPRLARARVILELGRYLVAEAGVYLTRVVDVKRVRGKTFVVTDGGMNHHISATGNWGQVFRKPYPILNLSASPDGAAEPVDLAGPCCTPLDLFGTDIALAPPRPGDVLGVFYSGAYGYSASSLRFLSHPEPAEVLLWQGAAHLLRPGGQPEDVLAGQTGLPAE